MSDASDRHDDPAAASEPAHPGNLRHRAASRLRGKAAAADSSAGALDTLLVLHALASSPETAADALTLLHELQVYQVELDLQAQELRNSRAELESALRRQIELHDSQPAGCFSVDARLVVHELNRSGAEMLGIARDEALGRPLDTFFHAESAGRLWAAATGVAAGRPRVVCTLELGPRHGMGRPVLASLGPGPEQGRVLVNLVAMDTTDRQPCDAAHAQGPH